MLSFTFPLRKIPDLDYHQPQPSTKHYRWFGAPRNGGTRKHAACDLIAPKGTEILAMADGQVIQSPYHFYEGTYALEVKHDNGMVVRYGEISKILPHGIMSGARVSQGQVIAYVGEMTFRDGSKSSMLHLEMYQGTRSGTLSGGGIYKRRSDLINPTEYLDNAIIWNGREPRPGEARVNHKVTSVLNVRKQATTSSPVLFTMSPGTLCKVIEEVSGSPYPPNNQTKWVKVQHGGQSGFTAAYYLDVATNGGGEQPLDNSVGRVNHRVTSLLNVRKQATTASDVVFTLSPGSTFQVLEEVSGEAYAGGRTDWCKIESHGRQGFGASYYIDINQEARPLTRWDQALPNVPTDGASAVTAGQDGLPPGIQASRTMAETDLARVKAIADHFCTAATKFGVPAAVLAAIASRESRCGNVLDVQGWGDGGNAFGVMQVDKNYHRVQGMPDPKSLEHIEQATGIFADCLEQVEHKHPDWEDSYILKGAAVAYNAGIGTVQTKAGMDIGTTGNDYGSDVMARAQYYANHGELTMLRAEI